ncbi:hypothetical protein [Desulfonatronum lacustre]|uniref:hypothetical protein n=1 Tax=Desulfonatronum lacustre TaxID=66849 RepID=UPI00146FAD37|nr:hypothetical protein [Desulfonatronum lacustre]
MNSPHIFLPVEQGSGNVRIFMMNMVGVLRVELDQFPRQGATLYCKDILRELL